MNLLPNDVLPSSSYVSRWTFRKITTLPSYSHGGFIMQNRDTFAFPHLSAASSLFISRRCKCSPASQFSYLNGLLQLFKYSLAFCVTEVRYNFTLGIKVFWLLTMSPDRFICRHTQGDSCGPPPFILPCLLRSWEAGPSLPTTKFPGPLASCEFG